MPHTNPYALRVSPSGPLVGGVDGGGNGFGNSLPGANVSPWAYQGTSNVATAIPTGTSTDYAGLGAGQCVNPQANGNVAPNMVTGYSYDIQFNMNYFASGGTVGSMKIAVLGASDGAPNTYNITLAESDYTFNSEGFAAAGASAVLRAIFVNSVDQTIVNVKVAFIGAASDLWYFPADGVLFIQQLWPIG